MSDLLLTVDAGTSASKAIVFDLAGRMISECAIPLRVDVPQPGWAELGPETLSDSIVASILGAMSSVDSRDIRGIGISGQLGLLPVDRQGKPLHNILTWIDRRAHAEAKRIDSIVPRKELYRITGRCVDPEWAACKILWFQQNESEIFRDTFKYLSLKDFVVHQMTGQFATDETHASYSLLFDVEKRRWDQDLFATLGIDPDRMPRVEQSTTIVGELTRQFAARIGLPHRIPVVVGAPDGTAAAVGAGLAAENCAVDVVGTTDVVFACTNRPVFDERMRTLVNCHAVPGKWIQGGPMSTTGGCLKWFCENFGDVDRSHSKQRGKTPYEEFDRQAGRLSPGCERLLFLPSLVGERTPDWDPNVRGVLFGLSLHHGRAHVYRAILEGSAFGVKHVVMTLEEQGIAADKMILVGGGAKSRLWATIRADVLGKPVAIPQIEQATGLGTAILIGVGLGLYRGFEHACEETVQLTNEIEPNERSQRSYDRIYPLFMQLRRNLKESFDALADLDLD